MNGRFWFGFVIGFLLGILVTIVSVFLWFVPVRQSTSSTTESATTIELAVDPTPTFSIASV